MTKNVGLPIPAFTLRGVFCELAERRNVEIHWLAVSAQAMNVTHNPQDEFESNTVRALAFGKEDYELAENGVFRHVGTNMLSSECLKCHLPNRASTQDRASGLVISMPIKN